ncbi:MAG TPA: hypothetical protein PKW33_03830 [Anaerolineaceae bacterium]|nr:hypothetical protein [Anaerolineaceae bacterium]HPN50691.1 hypothetical protein [Anaerolineaceae bacterium]
MSSSTDPLEHFIRAAAQTKKISPTEPVSRKQRWRVGVSLSLLLSLAFAAGFHWTIYSTHLPKPALWPLPVLLLSIILILLCGGFLGFLISLFDKAMYSAILAAGVVSAIPHLLLFPAFLYIYAWCLEFLKITLPVWILFLFTYSVLTMLGLPVMLLFRGMIDEQCDHRHEPLLSFRRHRLTLLAIAAAVFLGLIAYPSGFYNAK